MARKAKPKQGHLDGMEPPSVRAVDEAAEIYFDVMQDRCKLSKEEDEAKDNLIDKMNKAGLAMYHTVDGLLVTVTSKSSVKVKRTAESGEENGDGKADTD